MVAGKSCVNVAVALTLLFLFTINYSILRNIHSQCTPAVEFTYVYSISNESNWLHEFFPVPTGDTWLCIFGLSVYLSCFSGTFFFCARWILNQLDYVSEWCVHDLQWPRRRTIRLFWLSWFPKGRITDCMHSCFKLETWIHICRCQVFFVILISASNSNELFYRWH